MRRRHAFPITFVLLCSAFLLAGCDNTISTARSSSSIISSSVNEAAALSFIEEPRLISAPGGTVYTGPAVTENGFYEIVDPLDSAYIGGNIVYTDFSTRNRVYLSSQINTDHTSEDDTSYIPSLIGGSGILTDQNRLYVVKFGKPGLVEDFGKAGLSILYRMELNGANRKTIYLQANQIIVPDSGILAADGELIFLIREVQSDLTEHIILCFWNFVHEQTEKICDLSEQIDGRVFLSGFSSNKILLYQYAYDDHSSRAVRCWSYDIADGSCYPYFEFFDGNFALMGRQGELYYIKQENDQFSLYQIDPAAENHSILLCEKLAPTAGNYDTVFPGNNSLYPYFSFYFENSQTHEGARYQWNQEENIWLKEALVHNSKDVRIREILKDQFLIQLGDIKQSFVNYLPDGTPFQDTMLISQHALIQQEDYWNNVPNYIYFTDDVYKD